MSGMVLPREISNRQKRYLSRFTDICDDPRGKLLSDLFRGIKASGSTLLTEASRALQEPIDLIYTEKRLSRQLASPRFDVQSERVAAKLLGHEAARVKADDIIAVDTSDLAKPYARVMEDLCTVWDGSKKTSTKGYWLYESYRVDKDGQPHVMQLYPYSTMSCDFLSANSEFIVQLEALMDALNGRGILVMDRGCDRRGLYDDLLERPKVRWIIRQKGNRHLVGPGGNRKLVRTWAGELLADGSKMRFMEVRLPKSDEPLQLVVAAPLKEGDEPLMLLCRLNWWAYVATRAVKGYGKRWRAEDGMRAAKQGLGLEGFLVRTMFAIRALMRVAALVMAFVGELVETDKKLCEELLAMPHRLPKAVKVMLQPITTAIRYAQEHPP